MGSFQAIGWWVMELNTGGGKIVLNCKSKCHNCVLKLWDADIPDFFIRDLQMNDVL